MKQKVYVETTVVSYLTAWPSRDVVRLAHEVLTRKWWTNRRGDFDLYTSDIVIDESSKGDPTAAAQRLTALAGIPGLPVTEDAILLAEQLALTMALPARARADAAHVAIAAVHRMDFLLTWNCRHLANGTLAAKIEQCCAAAGCVAPRILTPELLMETA
jgi:hypothetical protein